MNLHLARTAGAALLASLPFVCAPAVAQTPVPQSLESLTGPADAAAPAPTASVEGFRSARFGMDEAAVRAAIETDCAVSGDAGRTGENPAERTAILTVDAPAVLEDGGAAEVSYVLGYQSDTLAQVSVLWTAGQGEVDADQLLANAEVLQSYFVQAGYVPETTIVNAAVPEGLLMFRGSDAEGRMTVLLLRGTLAPGEGEGAQPVLQPQSLLLAYLADPESPDVFRVEAGQF